MDTQEITRIVASNAVRIDLPMQLRSDPNSYPLFNVFCPTSQWSSSTSVSGNDAIKVKKRLKVLYSINAISNKKLLVGPQNNEAGSKSDERM